MLVDPDGKDLVDHWAKTRHEATLVDVDGLLAHPELEIQEVLEQMLDHPAFGRQAT